MSSSESVSGTSSNSTWGGEHEEFRTDTIGRDAENQATLYLNDEELRLKRPRNLERSAPVRPSYMIRHKRLDCVL